MDSPKTILVVEDDPDIRDTVAEILQGEGLVAARASDGLDALEQLRRGLAPDAILLDLLMPRLDGEGFVAAIRSDPRYAEIPIISMTASCDRGVDLPVTARLYKPFQLEELIAMVDAVLEPDDRGGQAAGTPLGSGAATHG